MTDRIQARILCCGREHRLQRGNMNECDACDHWYVLERTLRVPENRMLLESILHAIRDHAKDDLRRKLSEAERDRELDDGDHAASTREATEADVLVYRTAHRIYDVVIPYTP